MTFEPLRAIARRAATGVLVLAAAGALWTAGSAAQDDKDSAREAARLRKEIPDLPHLVRSTPNIYVIRVEKVEAPEIGKRGDDTEPESKVTASVLETLKGTATKKLSLDVSQRQPGAAEAGLFGGDLINDPSRLHKSPVFFSPDRFLTTRNPLFGGPFFEKNKLYVVFTNMDRTALLGGPYGYQPIGSLDTFWTQTLKRLVANPNSEHAISMSFEEFVRWHKSAFLMVIGDCLGTEVSISEPLWGDAVTRNDIDPAIILPESANACADALDQKRGYLGFIEPKPWLYQVRRGYPNQSYVEIRDGMLDFSELELDVGFPGDGRISVADLAERMSKGSAP